MYKNVERIAIIDFLQWNDRNGCYTDENCNLEDLPKLTYEDSIKYFFGVINENFYYGIADNIFELSYNEVINYAKENGFYNDTIRKLNILIYNKASEKIYRHLI